MAGFKFPPFFWFIWSFFFIIIIIIFENLIMFNLHKIWSADSFPFVYCWLSSILLLLLWLMKKKIRACSVANAIAIGTKKLRHKCAATNPSFPWIWIEDTLEQIFVDCGSLSLDFDGRIYETNRWSMRRNQSILIIFYFDSHQILFMWPTYSIFFFFVFLFKYNCIVLLLLFSVQSLWQTVNTKMNTPNFHSYLHFNHETV